MANGETIVITRRGVPVATIKDFRKGTVVEPGAVKKNQDLLDKAFALGKELAG